MRYARRRLGLERLECRQLLTVASCKLVPVQEHAAGPELTSLQFDSHQQTVSDDHGNDEGNATPVSIPNTTHATLETSADVDWFSFSAQSGATYRLETTLDTLSDSVLRLISSDGVTALATNDDFGGGLASRIEWEAVTSGQYFVEVDGYAGDIGSYQLKIDLLGDTNGDGLIGAADIDQLYASVASFSGDPRHDLNNDGSINFADVNHLVQVILGTSFGDANLDGTFDSADIVQVFTAGEYRDGIPGNSTWADGDWNGDREFTTSDITLAFQSGHFVSDTDDAYEDNDSIAHAADLGTIDGARTFQDLKLLDAADWYRFQTGSIGNESSISLRFQHAQGDLDYDLYDSNGQLIRQSTGVGDLEQVSLAGLSSGDYFLRVYGYSGARNASYSLEIDPGTPIAHSSGNTLWLNFDGARISQTQLAQWSTDWEIDGAHLDPERDGIQVGSFLSGTPGFSQREAIISQIITNVQNDLSAYGINVQRWSGSAVVNRGDTTIFLGGNTVGHVAGDIDFGNNNLTDIAFVNNEWWGDETSTALALADVVLHEAGHTYGLFHVDTHVGAVARPESMGLRYSESDTSRWVQDTSFVDRTFVEYLNHGGGRMSQNTHQTMLLNFGLSTASTSSGLLRYSVSDSGVFTLVASAQTDVIHARSLAGGLLELDVNGRQFQLGEGIQRVRVFTNGDKRDQVQIADGFSLEVIVDRAGAGDSADRQKVADAFASVWNGTAIADHQVHPLPGLDGMFPLSYSAPSFPAHALAALARRHPAETVDELSSEVLRPTQAAAIDACHAAAVDDCLAESELGDLFADIDIQVNEEHTESASGAANSDTLDGIV